ncbi:MULTISPECIES: hypothetical protein [unclassified Endozoicomonas]
MFDLDPLSLTMAIMAAVIFGATVTFQLWDYCRKKHNKHKH